MQLAQETAAPAADRPQTRQTRHCQLKLVARGSYQQHDTEPLKGPNAASNPPTAPESFLPVSETTRAEFVKLPGMRRISTTDAEAHVHTMGDLTTCLGGLHGTPLCEQARRLRALAEALLHAHTTPKGRGRDSSDRKARVTRWLAQHSETQGAASQHHWLIL